MKHRSIGAVALVGAAVLVLSGCAAGAQSPQSAYSGTVLIPALEPSVTSVEPAVGSVSGGEVVTITGVNLDGVTSVVFGEEEVTAVTVTSSTEVSVVAPRALDYQATTVVVGVLVDGEPVPATAPLSYDWQVITPVDKQMEYAFQHWDRPTYNLAEFGTFNPVGGDCVNFVSQTLLARGWEMTSDWYNRNGGSDWVRTWIHVPTFDSWLRANADRLGITELTLAQRDQVKVGDIVMFDWNLNDSLDHTQVVSSVEMVNGTNVITMVGHNKDTNFRDLDETITLDHPGGYVFFWSVP